MEQTTMACKSLSNVAIVNGIDAVRMSVIANRTNSMELGMIKAMMIESLKSKMRNGVTHFWYVRKDGTLKDAWGTLNPDLVRAHTNGRGESRENYATTAFYSVTDGGWRSFRWETLIKVF